MASIDLSCHSFTPRCSLELASLPVWIQALAVTAGAGDVATLGYVPVTGAVGSVAVLAESCVVVEPGRVDLAEAQGRPKCLGDQAGSAGVDGVAVAVAGCDPLEKQIPLPGLASPHDAVLDGAGPLLPLGGQLSRGHEFDAD